MSSEVASLFRKRDLLALSVILLGLYVTIDMHGLTYSIEPDWYIDQRKSRHSNMPNIPPIVTDLDGNGENEIVVITRDHYLKVLSASSEYNNKANIYSPFEEASVRLTMLNVQKGNLPVALETGYIDPYSESVGRKQVIVVVREDWTVSCFDMNLKQLWEKPISHKSHEMSSMANYYHIDDVSVYVTPLHLSEESVAEGSHSGVIIVGASMSPRDEEAFKQALQLEEGLQGESGTTEHPEMKLRAALEHYSVFALDSNDGTVIWRHDGMDVTPDQYIHSLPQHMFKDFKASVSDLASFHQSRGMNDWSVFRQSLLNELPHLWRDKEDGSMRIAHFVRKHMGAGAGTQISKKAAASPANKDNSKPNDPPSTTSANLNKLNPDNLKRKQQGSAKESNANRLGFFNGIESTPLSSSAELPHDSSEHIDHPNVVVAHTKRGIEVLALKTGTPITSLALSSQRTFADVDGDGVVDQLLLLERPQDVSAQSNALVHEHSNPNAQLQHCSLLVVSGLPPRGQLFNGSLCMAHRHLVDPIISHRANSNRALLPAEVSATAPVILKQIDERTNKESKYRDIVVAINSGIVTCFSARGQQKWQQNGLPTWPLGHKMHALVAVDFDAGRVEANGGYHDSPLSHLLVIGNRNMALLDPSNGEVETTADLPNLPIARPVLGDFDSDGVTDLILITDDAILGYKINAVQSVRFMFIGVLLLVVIAALVFFTNIRMIPLAGSQEFEEATTDGRRITHTLPQSKKRSVLSIIRSTDDHLD